MSCLLLAPCEGLKVVRLKGGDSSFGHGSEEILALREHGISWEVVPVSLPRVAVPNWRGFL